MRRYETMVIANPDLVDNQRAAFFDRIKEIIGQEGGRMVGIDEWGVRKLAYTIRKKNRGFYARLDYCGDGGTVGELERFFRIDDRAMKYMTIVLDKEVDMAAVEAEIAAAEEAKGDDAPKTATVKSDEAEKTEKTPEAKPAVTAIEDDASDAADETEEDEQEAVAAESETEED